MTLQEWLRHNQGHLQEYSLREVCLLARACGFETPDITTHVDGWLARSRRILALAERRDMWEKWTRATLAQQGFDYSDR